ncbi:MAG: MBL fold metallo-hydrolase [Lachnospiraceae bacterium]|nr:MBL fold metallo-hydrolase [Lachnospiraceae bacterium]MCH4031950.1 MBL fold metallo-hydrolase [Lachnospiraceae bacterium]MCH4070573.1 MBL fold metallo-hydrolase [Lachnospiraceae bacterium]MCH4109241.1 MBL fold metallo-hydrolase [Lachnospiraceae bacterium]MCI1303198.1 MBL fold metallo-hydrolase [Lachnospiraceae bacterium]
MFCNCSACQEARRLGGRNVRTRSQTLIDDTLLIDFPPDTNFHAVQYGLDLTKIKTILITHSHHDHFWAYDICMRMPPYVAGSRGKLTVYGNDWVRKLFYEAAADFHGADQFIEFRTVQPWQDFVTEDGYQVHTLLADHNQPELALNYIISRDGKTVLYAHDTGKFSEEYWNNLRGRYFQFISLDCTGLDQNWESGHMGFLAVDQTVARLKEEKCMDDQTIVVVNHFAHRSGFTHEKICSIEEPKNIKVAYDTCEFEV